MTTTILWQSESMWNGDIAQLTVNDESGQLAVITTDDGRPKVLLVSDEDAAGLAKAINRHLNLKAFEKGSKVDLRTATELSKEIFDHDAEAGSYEKSEKDAMWERGD